MRFDFSVMVWGERYVRVYLEMAIQSHLAALRQFPWAQDTLYRLFTDVATSRRISKNEHFRELASFVPVKFELFPSHEYAGKWSAVRDCHRRQVVLADERDAATYFLSADQILSPASFINAANHIVEGRTAVLCAGMRTNEEDMLRYLTGGPLGPRELVAAGLDHQHRETRLWHWDDPEYFKYGTYIYFKVGDEGVLAHCYVLHPLVVYPEVKNALFERIYDQDWLYNACPSIDRIYISQDFDEICQFEVSPYDMELPSSPAQHDDRVEAMAWYVKGRYKEHHLRFAFTPIRIHRGEMTPELWRPVEERALGIIRAIDERVRS